MERSNNNFSKTLKKLEKILWKLLEPNFQIRNDFSLNLLLPQWGKTESGGIKYNFKYKLNDMFIKWIIAAADLWIEKESIPPTPVLSFALNVSCNLSKDKNSFAKIHKENVYGKLAGIAKQNQDIDGLITLLSSVLVHPSGVQWLLTTSYWNDVIDMALKGPTNYIKQKSFQFIIKLLEITVLADKDFCEELIELLLEPLSEAAVKSELIEGSELEGRKLYKSLKPTLDLVSEVTTTLLKTFNRNVLNLFRETEIPEAIENILQFSKIQEFSYDLLKIRFVFLFYDLFTKLNEKKKIVHDPVTLFDIGLMFDLIKAEIEKDHVRCVIKICYDAHVLYCHLDNHVPLCIRKGEAIEFQNQMILFQLVPIMSLGQQFVGTHKSKQLTLNDELRQIFYAKLAKLSALKTLEITVRWDQRLSTKNDLIEDVTLSLQYILKSKTIINKEQAAFIFQPLIYTLRDAVCHLETYREIHMSIREKNYFKILIDTIIDLVESFDLTWKNSIETISVLDLACEILLYDYADYEITSNFLRLLNVAIANCMSPHMVLLMTNTNDSELSQVGRLLWSKCQNRSGQVRNTALGVVRTLALNAGTKFDGFTNVLFNAELPQLVVTMALGDSKYKVRETAMKCILELVMIQEIYEVYQSQDSFWDSVLNILVKEPKGSVRKEAAQLLFVILKHKHRFPENILPRLYDAMTHAAISDIHWEVQRNAILFWGKTIEMELQSLGMSNRMFPDYTFSKEKKKIVKLTQPEIRKLCIEALNRVSNMGTMYVLNTALQDKFDEEVSNAAKHTALQTVRLLTIFKITPDDVDLDQPSLAGDIQSNSDSSATFSCSQLSPAEYSTKNSPNSACSDSQSSPERSSDSSYPVSPTSSDNQTSPAGHLDLNIFQSQFPNSPSFSDLFDLSPNTPEYTESSRSFAALSTSSSSYPNNFSQYGENNNQKTDGQTTTITEEVENMNMDEFLENELFLEENMKTAIDADIIESGELFDEFLRLNDATLLEEIVCNSKYQVETPKVIKTRQYLPPSVYARSCMELAKTKEITPPQLVQDFEEFDALLNELLKEYDIKMRT